MNTASQIFDKTVAEIEALLAKNEANERIRKENLIKLLLKSLSGSQGELTCGK